MTDQGGRDALVKQDWIGTSGWLAGIHSGQSAFRCLAPYLGRVAQVGLKDTAVTCIITLHTVASSCNRNAAQGAVGAGISARKSVACGQMNLACTVRGTRSLHLGNAFDGQRCGFSLGCVTLQFFGGGFWCRIVQFKNIGIPIGHQLGRIGEACILINRGLFGHRDGTLGHLVNRTCGCIRGRNVSNSLADENPQTNVDPFGTFGVFQRACAHVDRNRCTLYGHRIGVVSAGTFGSG